MGNLFLHCFDRVGEVGSRVRRKEILDRETESFDTSMVCNQRDFFFDGVVRQGIRLFARDSPEYMNLRRVPCSHCAHDLTRGVSAQRRVTWTRTNSTLRHLFSRRLFKSNPAILAARMHPFNAHKYYVADRLYHRDFLVLLIRTCGRLANLVRRVSSSSSVRLGTLNLLSLGRY